MDEQVQSVSRGKLTYELMESEPPSNLNEIDNQLEYDDKVTCSTGSDEVTGEEISTEEEEDVSCCTDCASVRTNESESSCKTGWARFGDEDDPWADGKMPVVQILSYNSLILTDDEANGILSDRVIAACSKFLDRNPESQKYTLGRVDLCGKELIDITILAAHRYLQYINLSKNCLTDVSPLSDIPYLMHLDVSHNLLTSVLTFKAPWNLTSVNYSHNKVQHIDDLNDFWSLVHLNLSHNEIEKIEGLDKLRYLRDLDLSFNKIRKFEALNYTRIKILNISHNLISTFEEGLRVGIKTMLYLSAIDISFNELSTLAILKDVYHLRTCILGDNQVTELLEIDHMQSMHLLTELDLAGNPMTAWQRYRELVIRSIPSLTVLDGAPVDVQEKIAANILFDASEYINAADIRAEFLGIESDNAPEINLDIWPHDEPPHPLIVLVGPSGSTKHALVGILAEQMRDKLCIGVRHTTRSKYVTDVDGQDYHFVSRDKFNEMSRSGTFLCVTEKVGTGYGFSKKELARSVKEQKVCITEMGLLDALILKARGLTPYLILVMPDSEEIHYQNLSLKYQAIEYVSSGGMKPSGAVLLRKRHLLPESRFSAVISAQILDYILKQMFPSTIDLEECIEINTANAPPDELVEAERRDSGLLQLNERSVNMDSVRISINTDTSTHTSTFSEEQEGYVKTQVTFDHYVPTEEKETTATSSYVSSSLEHNSSYSVPQPSTDIDRTVVETIASRSDVEAMASVTHVHVASTESDGVHVASTESDGVHVASTESDGVHVLSTTSAATVEANHIKSVLNKRQLYIDAHLQNPGLFLKSLNSDDMDTAMLELKNTVDDIIASLPKRYPLLDVQDVAYKVMIPQRLERYQREVCRDQFIMEKQLEEMHTLLS